MGNFRNIKSKQRKRRVRKQATEDFSVILFLLILSWFFSTKRLTIVKEDLQKVCEYVFLHEKEFTDEYLSGSKRETVKFQAKTKAELKRLSERQEEIGKIIRKLYEDNINGRITDERFDLLVIQ